MGQGPDKPNIDAPAPDATPRRTGPPGLSPARRPLPESSARDSDGRKAVPEERIDRLDRLAGRFMLHAVWVAFLGASVLQPFVFQDRVLGPEAADYAQIGRNVARGQGFRTDAVVPLTVGMGWPVQATPELAKPPLPSLLMGLAYRGLGESDTVTLGLQYASLCVCLIVLYWVGARAFGTTAGLLTVALIALNPSVVALAARYGNVSICAALMACVLLTLTYVSGDGRGGARSSPAPRASRRQSVGVFLAGLLFGLAYLSEYALLAVLVPLLMQVYSLAAREKRWRNTGLALLGFLIVALPWWVRCWVLFRAPVVSLDRYVAMLFTDAHPGTTLLRSVSVPGDPYLFLLTHPKAVLANLLRCGAGLSDSLPVVASSMVIGGAALLYLTSLKSASDACWRRLLLGGAIAVLLATAFTIQFTVVNFMPLLPLAALLAAAALVRLVRGLGGWRGVVVGGALAVLLVIPAWARPETSVPAEARMVAANLRGLSRVLPRNAVVISDTPQLVAWYADRPTVWLPATQDLQAVVSSARAPIVLFLSDGLARWPSADGAQFYQELLMAREVPPGFAELDLPVPGARCLVPRPRDAAE